MKLNLWNISFLLRVNVAHKPKSNFTLVELLYNSPFGRSYCEKWKEFAILNVLHLFWNESQVILPETEWVSKVISILLFLKLIYSHTQFLLEKITFLLSLSSPLFSPDNSSTNFSTVDGVS